jgi:hypothetical protein
MAINRELSQFGRLVQIIDNVSIGIGTTSNVSIGFGTISATTFSGSNILVGTATSTGTASQRLQVTGGAYVSGSVGIGTTNPGSTLDVRATGATIRVQNPAAANYSVLLDPSAVGPRVSFGVNADSSFMEFGAYNLFNNLDTKNRDLKIFSTAAPDAFILRQATGNIGIGTTNPSDKLHVLGSNIRIDSASGSLNFWSGAGFYGGIGVLNAFGGSGTDIVLRADSGRSLIFQTGGANDRGRIDANGTFLVGSATSTGTASQRLQVTGGAYVSGNLGVGRTNPSALFHLTGGSAIGAIIERNSTGESYIRYQNSSGTMHAGISTGATFWGIGDSTNFTNSPYFVVRNTTGSVGIGTNNPTVALQLSPNASISNVGSGITLPGTVGSALTVAQFLHVNTNTSYLRIKATRNATGSDWFSASTKLVNVTDVTEQGYIEYNPNGSLYGMAFGQGGTEWARFLQSGNLGIGTTTPTSRLSVVGDGKFSGVVTATKFVGDGSLLTNLPSGGSSGGGTSSQWTTGATGITTTSNVGIGTTNASYKLHVVGSGTTTLIIDNGSAKIVGNLNVTGTVYATDFDMVPGGGGYQSLPGIVTSIIAGSGITISPTNGTGAVTIYSTNTSQWTSSVSGISTTSNVGINSSIPTSALDVLGNAKISGVTTASSFVKSGGTSSQFLKADGSVDSSTYLTSYTETDTLNSVTGRGNSTSNGISVGVLTATSIVKSGGTSSQFLKADGSVDSSTYLTSYTETDTLNSVTSRGNSTSNGISVGVLTATRGNFTGIITSTGANIFGNLGIGTTNPGERLQVDGNLRLGGSTTSNYIAFYGTNGDQPGSYSHTYIGERVWSTGTERSELLLFKGNDAEVSNGWDRIRLAASQVRIDTYTTATGGNTFENIATSANLINRVVVHSTGEVGIGTDASTGTASQPLQVTGGAYVSTRLGIGQTNPNTALHIGPYNGNTLPHLYLASGNNLYGWRIDTQDFGGGSVPLRIWRRVNGTDTESITVLNQNGNVGIGTTNPTSALDIVGDAKVSGVTTASSFVKSGGTSSQFLKADGSVDSSTYLTSYTETDTLNSVTSRGNSTSNGISVGVLTATRGNFTGIITSTGANISGVTTATSFSGSGSGITGLTNSNLSGSAGITNANLANSTISGVSLGSNLNTLTLNTSGTGLSGSTTYNGSGASTFTVTSNATSANTASTIVARDSSGNFSAGTITASLSGNATSATTATNAQGLTGTPNISVGTINSGTLTVSGDINYTGTIKQSGSTVIQWVEITPVVFEFSWSGTQTFSVTPTNSIPPSTRYILADVFITANSGDHQNIVLGRSSVSSQKNWVDSRGAQPSGQFGTLTRHAVTLTYNGEADGYSPNYGLWFSSQHIPSDGRTIYFNNYGNSGSGGWVYIVIKGYSL